jgi:DNA-binding CsgD family transcriptional regulator
MATMTDQQAATVYGRDDELRRLADGLAAARAGRPAVALVDGPPGIGKTALVRHFLGEHDDVRVLWASGDVSERSVPYAVADQVVRQGRAGPPATPVLSQAPAHYTGVGLSVLELIGEVQRTAPVVLVVDDAHWADPASLRALLFAVRRLVADAALVILTARSEDLHVLPDGFTRMAESPPGARITLGPLDLDTTRMIARRRDLPLSAHAVRRVHELAAGVPLHLCALLDEVTARGDVTRVTTPSSYATLITGRLSQCSAATRRLVEAAAVLGRHATLYDVAHVGGLEGDPLTALDEAIERDLIRVTKRSIEFVHPLVRSAIHEAIAPVRLAELHTAAAARVEEPSLAMLHRARAAVAPDARIAAELELAGRAAAAEGHWLRAADLYAEAAELSPARSDRERRILELVGAQLDAGDLVAARSMSPEIHAFRVAAEREFALGRIALSELDVPSAQQHFEAAWREAADADGALRMRIATELGFCAYFRLDAAAQLAWAQRAAALAPPGAAPRILALALAMNGRLREGLAGLEGVAGGPQMQLTRGRLRLIDDDLAGARADLGKARTAALHGPSRAAAMALGRLAMLEYLEGHWDLALTYAEQGVAACVDRTDFAQITAIRAPAVLVLAGQGAFADAQQHLQAMLAETADVPLPAAYTALAGARLAAATGDPDAVLDALAPILALGAREAIDEPGVWPWQELYADALIDLGRLEEADRFLAPHEARARDRERRSMIGRLARSRARLAAARGENDRAHEAFAASSEALAAVGLPHELALTELEHGRFLRRRRQRRAAVEVLANARERLMALGARPALQACERELQASGLAPKRPAAKGLGRLTPQETTVARLVVDGMTNREIAGELMVSTKTVEVHLTNVYAKLEVPSRAELRARARRGELEMLAG